MKMKFKIRRQQHHSLIGYIIMAIPLMVAFFSVGITVESIEVVVAIILLGVFFMVALVDQLIDDRKSSMKIRFDLKEISCLIVAVFITYASNHFLGMYVVLSASLVGLLGFLLLKKYQLAIYCGAFAGMVSLTLFDFFEVAILALVCSVLFSLTKTAFKGYGGKLGFVAFMSSFIVHVVFNDAYLPAHINLNIYGLVIAAILGGVSTYLINHRIEKTSSVLASAIPTLIVSIISIYLYAHYLDYLPMFFAGTFLGMSSKTKLNHVIYLIISCVILAYIYTIYEDSYIGLGGKLGFMSIFSVLIIHGFEKFIQLFKISKQNV